jgi:hypothetical protein
MIKITDILKQILLEEKAKRDRCLRIADRKFDKPSAYKSGAVVRCRQGSIWKGINEEEELNEIGDASAKPYKWKEYYEHDFTFDVGFETDSGLTYSVVLDYDEYNDKPVLDVQFSAGKIDKDDEYGDDEMDVNIITNRGELFRVMATIVGIIKHYVDYTEARGVTYTPSKKEGEKELNNQRSRLYKAFLQKQIPGVKIKEKGDYIAAIFPKKKKINEDESLHKWFNRQGAPGKNKGWVDCNTCRDGKCKPCGRAKGETRSKYPSCRPTPSACKRPGKGKTWGKTK